MRRRTRERERGREWGGWRREKRVERRGRKILCVSLWLVLFSLSLSFSLCASDVDAAALLRWYRSSHRTSYVSRIRHGRGHGRTSTRTTPSFSCAFIPEQQIFFPLFLAFSSYPHFLRILCAFRPFSSFFCVSSFFCSSCVSNRSHFLYNFTISRSKMNEEKKIPLPINN